MSGSGDQRPAGASLELPLDLRHNPRLSRWVELRADGPVVLRVGKVELGQGILTALAQIAADELGVPLQGVEVAAANTWQSPDEGLTAGSLSVFQAGPAVRLACANVRALCVAEAARRWDVPEDTVQVGDGRLTADGHATTYAELAGAVDLDVEVSADVPTSAGPVLVGASAPRLDLPGKIAGRPCYISDLRLPGMQFGRVVRPPSPAARLASVDPSAIEQTTAHVVRDGSFLGVVAADPPGADRAAALLGQAASWHESSELPDEDDLATFLRAGPHEDVRLLDEPATADVVTTIRGEYFRPFTAHASMAPSCAVARWHPDRRELMVWSNSQGINRLRDALAQALSLSPEAVRVQHVENAGVYGHNGADDVAFDAAILARAVPGTPVQVSWSRQEELGWSGFGSAMVSTVVAGLDSDDRIVSWGYDVWSQGHTARPGYSGVPGFISGDLLATPLDRPAPADPPHHQGGGTTRNAVPLYDVGARRVSGHRLRRTPIRSTALRALGAFHNVFSIESAIDEAALHVGQDPVEFRLRHLSDPRAADVLRAAAAASGWGTPLPDGHGRGVGLARYKERGAYCAVVAEVEAESSVQVRRLTIAVDVGQVVNPDGVRNQIEGGATQATSWALKERVRFDRTRITSVDWETYPILRFSEAPAVEVVLLDRPGETSVGAGEAAQGPTAGAIGNAIADAVGVRVRQMPFTTEAIVAAIEQDGG